MNIIITGADGFIGSNLINYLNKTNHQLLLVGCELTKMKGLTQKDSYCYSYKDISPSEMSVAFKNFKPDTLIHLAAYSTASDAYNDMEKLIEANIFYLCKILDALKNTRIKSFVYTGTFAEFFKGDGVYDPAYLYAATKTAGRYLATYYAHNYHFKLISICPFTVYGGIDNSKKIIDFLYDSLSSKTPVDVTSGEQVLDFIHLDDIVKLFVEVVEKHKLIPDGTIFQAGTGQGHTFKELVQIMEKETGLKANLNWGGRAYRPRDIMYAVANISEQKKILNHVPQIMLNEGVKAYLKKKLKNEN